MNKIFRSLACLSAMLTLSLSANAQAKLHVVSGLETTHIWRGLEVSKGLTFDNEIAISDKNNHFRFGLWGGMQINGNYKEFDYYVQYSNNGFTASVWDIYNFSDGIYNNDNCYKIFNYDCHDTGHFIDAGISYDFSAIAPKFPLTLSWNTVIAGRDRGVTNDHNLYSTYVQAAYKVYEDDNFIITPSVGCNFALNPEKDIKGTFYGDRNFGVNDVRINATYKLKIANHPFPVTTTAMWNPEANKGYFCVSVNLLNL